MRGTSPTIGQDGTVYAGWSDLYAVNPTNGSIKWVFDPGPDRCIEGGTSCSFRGRYDLFWCLISGKIRVGKSSQLIQMEQKMEEIQLPIKEVESAPAISEDGTVYIGSSLETRWRFPSCVWSR